MDKQATTADRLDGAQERNEQAIMGGHACAICSRLGGQNLAAPHCWIWFGEIGAANSEQETRSSDCRANRDEHEGTRKCLFRLLYLMYRGRRTGRRVTKASRWLVSQLPKK